MVSVDALDGESELGQVGVADDLAELLLGFEHPGSRPPEAHIAALPALDVAGCAPEDADHRLDRVGRLHVVRRLPTIPSRVSVMVSSSPSRNEHAPGKGPATGVPARSRFARAMPRRDSPVPPVVLRRSRQSPPGQYTPGYLLQPCVPQADQAATLTLHPHGHSRDFYPDVCLRLGRLRSSRPGYSPGRAL